MNRSEKLILHYVYDLRIRLGEIFDEELEIRLNLPHHNLAEPALREVLQRFLDAELIEIKPFNGPWCDGRSYDIDTDLYYGLTPKGGAVWQSYFHPDWSRFCSFQEEPLSEDKWLKVIKYSDPAMTEIFTRILANKQFLFDRLSLWNPLYWKESSRGFVMTYIGDVDDVRVWDFLNDYEWFDKQAFVRA